MVTADSFPSQNFNVGLTLFQRCRSTLKRRGKWNKIQRQILNVAQRWYNVGVWRWSNVDTFLSLIFISSFFYKQNTVDNCFVMEELWHIFTWKFPKVLVELFFITPLGGCLWNCFSKEEHVLSLRQKRE